MLTKRIIACLDVRGGRVVKGVQFVDIVDAGDPAELAARHAAAGADEIVLLDITATHEGRSTLLDTVKRTAARLFVPFTVGGGIRSAEEAEAVFRAGADKVSINSAAIARPALIGEIGASFGAQAVIVAIDARRGERGVADAEVYVSGGRKATGLRVVEWAQEAEARGAGEILLTSMDADGTRGGFDCELTASVSAAVQIPVIASGGAGTAAHFAEVFGQHPGGGKADAALAASIFHFGVTDSRALKAELQRAGVPVRLPCLKPIQKWYALATAAFLAVQSIGFACLLGGTQFTVTPTGHRARILALMLLEPGFILMEMFGESPAFPYRMSLRRTYWLGALLGVVFNALCFAAMLWLIHPRLRRAVEKRRTNAC